MNRKILSKKQFFLPLMCPTTQLRPEYHDKSFSQHQMDMIIVNGCTNQTFHNGLPPFHVTHVRNTYYLPPSS